MYNSTLMTIRTSNKENGIYDLVVGIDLGVVRLATMVDTDGNVEFMDKGVVMGYCKEIERGHYKEEMLNIWLYSIANDYVKKWKIAGVEAVYIGCCKGDYLTLCGNKRNHPFYKYGVFEKLVRFFEQLCSKENIHIEATSFDESYTSRANALNSDYIPNHGDKNIPGFSGKRVMGQYIIDKNISINSDVNAAMNILHKAGFNIRVTVNCNLLEAIRHAKV